MQVYFERPVVQVLFVRFWVMEVVLDVRRFPFVKWQQASRRYPLYDNLLKASAFFIWCRKIWEGGVEDAL